MDKMEFEVGQIVNAHGIRGDLRVKPLNLPPQWLANARRLLLDGREVTPESGRVHKDLVLLKLPGVDDMDAALALKGHILSARREDLPLKPEEFLDAELIGMEAFDAETGVLLGKVTEVTDYPAHKVYTVRGDREYLIPAVPQVFIASVDRAKGRMEIHMLEGLATDEN